jgi:alpha-N-acetylglucosamine transferase
VRRAFVTLVTGAEYAPGAVALARSLCAHSSHPLIIMCPARLEGLADWSRLDGTMAQVRTIDPLPLSRSFVERHRTGAVHARDPFLHGTKPRYHSVLDNFMKLRAWQFEEYDRVAFLDADTLSIRNPDSIFRYPPFAGAPNVYTPADTRRRLNGGVFVLRPDVGRFDELLRELDAAGAYWRRSDQTFLEAAFPDWDRLPEGYNRLQYVWVNMPERWCWEEILILHYQFEKPWDRDGRGNPALAPLTELWWHVFEEGRLPARLPVPPSARSR